MKFCTNARRTSELLPHEAEHAKVAKRVAGEGIVLLENRGGLPIDISEKIALYGEGAAMTVRGGIGSGEVNCRYVVSIWDGLKSAGFKITTEDWLQGYLDTYEEKKDEYTKQMRKKAGVFNFNNLSYILGHPFMNPEGQLIGKDYLAKDTSVCIYVISRQAGENVDRMPVKGDFCLSDRELENLRTCRKYYKKLIVIINVGGYMDLSPLDEIGTEAVVFFGQQGAEGGHALADIISGKVSPSGHLTATWPKSYEDVPYGMEYSILNGNTVYEDYKENIYVGYRYYDTFQVEPRYHFGHGLTYTTFLYTSNVHVEKSEVIVEVQVTNVGKNDAKSVVQCYVTLPDGKLEKEAHRLVAFGKTKCLQEGETEKLWLTFCMEDLASFDEESHCSVLEKGNYVIEIGENSGNTSDVAVLYLENTVRLAEYESVCPLHKEFEVLRVSQELRDIRNKRDSERAEKLPKYEIQLELFKTFYPAYRKIKEKKSAEIEVMQKLLSKDELTDICVGSGLDVGLPKYHDFIIPGACGYSTSMFEKRGIPSISFCDGPAGLRVFDECVVQGNTVRMVKPVMASFDFLPLIARKVMIRPRKEGKMLYQYTTAFPSGLAMGQTWNVELLVEVGQAIQEEMKVYGAEVWLAPGMNLHRNPLCGRNYEYYSEDPMLSGTLAAAVCNSVQSNPGYGVTVKHYACNNQEIDRRTISENVSERALRELYLRNFEIAVKKGNPKALMTSYNKVNGVYAAENYDLITKILRNEWCYEGMIMTDWTTEANMLDASKAMKAGVNLMMPGIGTDKKAIRKALKKGLISEAEMRVSASYVLEVIVGSKLFRNKEGGK